MIPGLNILKKIFKTSNERKLAEIQPLVQKINLLEPEIQKLSDQELKNKTQEFKNRIKNGKNSPNFYLLSARNKNNEAAKQVFDVFSKQHVCKYVAVGGGGGLQQHLAQPSDICPNCRPICPVPDF